MPPEPSHTDTHHITHDHGSTSFDVLLSRSGTIRIRGREVSLRRCIELGATSVEEDAAVADGAVRSAGKGVQASLKAGLHLCINLKTQHTVQHLLVQTQPTVTKESATQGGGANNG